RSVLKGAVIDKHRGAAEPGRNVAVVRGVDIVIHDANATHAEIYRGPRLDYPIRVAASLLGAVGGLNSCRGRLRKAVDGRCRMIVVCLDRRPAGRCWCFFCRFPGRTHRLSSASLRWSPKTPQSQWACT